MGAGDGVAAVLVRYKPGSAALSIQESSSLNLLLPVWTSSDFVEVNRIGGAAAAAAAAAAAGGGGREKRRGLPVKRFIKQRAAGKQRATGS